MKILKLRLQNIKCFEEIEISFEGRKGDPRNWVLFVGNNGQGKTTVLRSLALGLCDEAGVDALRADLYGEFLRRGESEGCIEVCLKDGAADEKYTVKTRIKSDGIEESVSQKVFLGDRVSKKNGKAAKDFKRDNIFAVSYGAGRPVTGKNSYDEYALVDSLYTLFNYEHSLWNPEIAASRVKINTEDEEWEKLQDTLEKVLMLEDDDEISLESTGLHIKTRRGKDSFHTLSDGYKSLTSVVLDILCWNLIYKLEDFHVENLSGIFILDEIEQHLHPKWQRKIIKILSDQFPKVQFICSTHTPICALGLSDLECESRLFKVAHVNNHSEVEEFDLAKEFRGYRADQILTSNIFDLADTRSVSVGDKLKEYRKIYLKEEDERSEEERKRLLKIEKELERLPMWDNEKDRIHREELIALLKNRRKS